MRKRRWAREQQQEAAAAVPSTAPSQALAPFLFLPSSIMASAAPTVKVVVTGGGGFLGRYLCQTLLRRKRLNGRALESIAILDAGADTHVPCDTKVQVFPNGPTNGASSNIRLETYRGDITDRKLVQEVLRPGPGCGGVTVFHLASIMSGQGEEEFDKCLNVNLGT